MATWHELTRDPEYQALSQKAKALVKQGFFQQQIANDPEYQSFSPETQKAIADDFWNTPDDTGQGYVSSMLGSAGRGFGEIVPGTVTGVGALLGSEGIQGAGESLREGLEYIAPVNPIYQDDLAMKGMNVLGTVGSIMATGGIGGAAGRGLAAEGIAAAGTQAAKQALARQAIQRGASSALYGTGFAQGAAQKAEENKRLGMEGPEAYLNLIGGGLSEVLPEMLPFGTALETAAARRMLGGVDEAGKVIPGIRMSAAQEALEGGTTQSLSNLSTQLTAPEGVETPGLFEGFGEAALWEGVGGSMFGAINKLGRTPLDKQTEAQNRIATEAGAIPTNAVPEQTNEQKLAAMQAGGTTVVDPDGKTAVLVEPPKVAPSDPGMAAARDLVTPTANVEGAQANAELAKKQIDESDELAKTAVAAIEGMSPPPTEPAVPPVKTAEAVEPEVTGIEPTSSISDYDVDEVADTWLSTQPKGMAESIAKNAQQAVNENRPFFGGFVDENGDLVLGRFAAYRQALRRIGKDVDINNPIGDLQRWKKSGVKNYPIIDYVPTSLSQISSVTPSLPETGMQPVVDQEAPAGTPVQAAPLSEGAERNRAIIAEAAANLSGRGRISAGLQAAIPQQTPQENAPDQIPLKESLLQEPQDRVESREAEGAGVGDQLLGAAAGEEEVVAPTRDATKPEQMTPEEAMRVLEERIGPNNPKHPDYSRPDWREIESRVESGEELDAVLIDTAEGYLQIERDRDAREAAEIEAIRTSPEKEYVRTQAKMTPDQFDRDVTLPELKRRNAGKKIAKDADILKRLKSLRGDGDYLHRKSIEEASSARLPVSSAAVDTYGINLPEGYVKQGDLYVFQPGATGEPVQAAPSAAQAVKATAPGPIPQTTKVATQTETAAPSAKGAEQTSNKIYLNVPFTSKDNAKSLGAKWDKDKKLWFIQKNDNGFMPTVPERWIPDEQSVLSDKKELSAAKVNAEVKYNRVVEVVEITIAGSKAFALKFADGEWLNPNVEKNEQGFQPPSQKASIWTLPIEETEDKIWQQVFDRESAKLDAMKKGKRNPKSPYFNLRDSEIEKQQWEMDRLKNNKNSIGIEWGELVRAFDESLANGEPISANQEQLFVAKRLPREEFFARLRNAGYEQRGETFYPKQSSAGGGTVSQTRINPPSPAGGTIQTTAAEKQTPAPSRKGAGAAGVTERQPSGGSIPEVAPSETQETQPSTKENDAVAKEDRDRENKEIKKGEEVRRARKSVIDPAKTNIEYDKVTTAIVEAARRQLQNSGEIPNAILTRIYASPEAFLADRSNQRYFPAAYARIMAEPNVEGLYADKTTFVFASNVGVSDLDRGIAEARGISAEQAAARRVIAHENGHRGVDLFEPWELREFRSFVNRTYTTEEIDNLVRLYTEFADWRTNPVSRNEALEEIFQKKFERLVKIPTGGIWDDIVQFLKRVWRRLTGRKGDPTLQDMKDVVRLLRNAMRRTAVPSFTTKNGGEVKLSLSDRFQGVTPEQDAEYLAAVEAGDMEKAQRMVDEAANATLGFPRDAKTGEPVKVQHDTPAVFTEFKPGGDDPSRSGRAIWLGVWESSLKAGHRVGNRSNPKNRTLRLYADLKRPLILDSEEMVDFARAAFMEGESDFKKREFPLLISDEVLGRIKADGYDGIIFDTAEDRAEMQRRIDEHVRQAKRLGLSEKTDQRVFDKVEIIAFSPNQIKSADPVTYDDAGNVIPLSQRFQTASPDIRFSRVEYENKPSLVINPRASSSYSGRGVASIPTSDNSARAQAIREGVSRANWDDLSTAQRAKALEEFGRATISSRYSFDAAILPVRESNKGTPQNRPASIYVERPSPAIEIRLDTRGLSGLLSGDAITAFSAIYDIAQEEVIHTAQHLNAYAKWQDSGVMLPFEEFEVNYYTSMLLEMVRAAGAGLSGGDARVANIIVSAWNLYNPNVPSNDINQIVANLVQDKAVPSFTMEIGRQLIQLKRQDFTSETGWMRFVEAMKGYLTDAVEALKTSLSLVRSGQAGEMIRREIQDVESILNRLETNPDSILPDAKPSRVEYASDYSASVSAGAQLARDTVYDDRIIEMRDAIRRAYEQSNTEAGVAMPLDELYAKTKELAPDMTENEFGNILQDLYEDNGAVLQEGESAFDVFTPEGRRAGFAVIMPKRAVASRVETEGEAVDEYKKKIEAIDSNSLNAFFGGRQVKGASPQVRTVKPSKSYEQAAIELVNDLTKDRTPIEDIAESLFSDEFLQGLGIKLDIPALVSLIAEVKNRVSNQSRDDKIPGARRIKLQKLDRKLAGYWQDLGTNSGRSQGIRSYITRNPRYSWMFIFDRANENLEKEGKLAATRVASDLPQTADNLQKTDVKAGEDAGEQVADDLEDNQDAIDLAAGEATLTDPEKSIYEQIKDDLRAIGFLQRLEKDEKKAASAKASLSNEDRNFLAKLTPEERKAEIAKRMKRVSENLRKLTGEESAAKTPEQKATRKKREKMVATAKKRAEQGKPIEAPSISKMELIEQMFVGFNDRDSIINEVGDALLKAAEQRKVKPKQKTAIQDLIAAIRQTLTANLKGEQIKADQPSLGKLLGKTFAQQGSEAALFAKSWEDGRKKVRAMLAEMGVDEASLDEELDAIMPPTPTLAYAPAAAKKAINVAIKEAGLTPQDALSNPAFFRESIMAKFNEAAEKDNLTEEGWNQSGKALAEKAINEFIDNARIKAEKRSAESKAKMEKRKVEIADKRASQLIYSVEEQFRQNSKDLQTSKSGDSINKAFRDQVKNPVSKFEFFNRLAKLNVSQNVSERLFRTAAREKADLQAMEAFRRLEGPNALQTMLREIQNMRRGEEIPLRSPIPWRKLLSQKASTVEIYRQRIFDAISSEESLANLDDAQKAKLADLFTQAWESKRKAILDRMVDNAINQEEAAGRLTREGADALRSQRQKLVEDINLGILDEDRLMKHLADKFGIKSEFTEAERANIDRLLDILQDDKLNEVKRNKAAYELLEALSSATKIPIAKLLADYWVSSVLSGVNTAASIAMAVMSGGYELTTGAFRILRAGFTNPKELPAEIAASFKAMAEFLKAFGREGRLAWQYLVTGDRALLDPSLHNVRNDLNYDSIGKTVSLAERMAKSDKVLEKVMGIWMRSVSRLLTALDNFNTGVTKAGALPIVFRQLNLSAEDLQRATEKYNLQLYRDKVIQRDFNGNKPTTAHDKALVDSYAKAEMMTDLQEFGKFSENADFFGQQGAMTLDPTGIGGFIYSSIKSFTGGATNRADKFLAEAEREWKQADGADKTAKGLQLAFAYFLQFGAYNIANLAGLRFARFAGNKFNQGLSFIPGIGMLRMYEATAKDSKIEAKDAFTDMIMRNQLAGLLLSLAGFAVIQAIMDEPDDEKRGWFINGGWANLTPDRKQQKLAAGQKEFTIGIGGKVYNYQNWPISPILAAIGSLSDLIRFSPEQWNEKAMADRIVSAAASGVFSAGEIPALSGFQTLFGNNLSSKDPNEKRLDRFAKVMAGWGGGFVPRILKDIDFMADPGLRKYESLWEQTASHIPVYRRYSGEEYYDILGKQIERKVWPGSREFMELETDPEYRTLGKLNSRGIWLTPANAEHRMVGKGRFKRKLTQEEADAYSLETGKGYRQMLLRYGSRLEQMPTERARAFLMDKADEVRDRALQKITR